MNYSKVIPGLIFSLLFSKMTMAGSLITSQEFIDIASIRSISEVETAKIALEKSNSPDVKAYAQRVLEEQKGTLKDLRKLAEVQHLNMLSEAELQAKARTFVFQRNGRAFDAAYADMRVVERRKSVSLFREAAAMADEGIKQYATRELPMLMQHLYMAQTLTSDVAKTTTMVADNSSHL